MTSIQRGVGLRVYDEIGKTYASTRAPDPAIAQQVWSALGPSETVLNVGAGTGSYEPEERLVIALEPSSKMIEQRKPEAAPVVCGVAEQIPFPDNSFDAVLAILTLHHWTDQSAGLSELNRVARERVVILTFDATQSDRFWLVRDYFPRVKDMDGDIFPDPIEVLEHFHQGHIDPVMIPETCQDGFLCAFWKRPEAYLDPVVRAGISCFPALPSNDLEKGVSALEADLKSGQWERRNRELLPRKTMDYGYRLIVAELS